ncbi:MAG: hypothetical protein PPP58_09710 [Natronomonas sp.]
MSDDDPEPRTDDSTPDDAATDGTTETPDDPFGDIEGSVSDGPLQDPFEELDDTDEELESLFTEVDVEAVDDEAIWSELTDPEVGSDDDDSTETTTDVDGETVVPIRRYCGTCEHFSEPPAVRCTHPGTDIEELVDTDHFRVRNCPIVRERADEERLTD